MLRPWACSFCTSDMKFGPWLICAFYLEPSWKWIVAAGTIGCGVGWKFASLLLNWRYHASSVFGNGMSDCGRCWACWIPWEWKKGPQTEETAPNARWWQKNDGKTTKLRVMRNHSWCGRKSIRINCTRRWYKMTFRGSYVPVSNNTNAKKYRRESNNRFGVGIVLMASDVVIEIVKSQKRRTKHR